METSSLQTLLFTILCTFLLQFSRFTSSQSFIGVNYGIVADNLPAPEATAKLLQSTSVGKVRMYGADPAMIRALANTGIGIVIGAANGDIPALASDPSFATQWVNSNVLGYPDSKISVITVGNEVMSSVDQSLVSLCLPAMQNVQNALNAASLGGKIKVSTVHSMAVLASSDPPSSAVFNSGFSDTMRSLLKFHSANGSPFMINPYPFFAYQSDPRPETLAFCLFQPNAGRVDSATGIKYMNMFDAQVLPKLTVRSLMTIPKDIKAKLSDEEQQLFKAGPFKHWLEYEQKDRGAPLLIALFLEHQIEVENPHPESLYYRIGSHQRRYGREEFMLITGLPFGTPPTLSDFAGNPFIMRCFPQTASQVPRGKPLVVRVEDLLTLFKNMRNLGAEDKVRICNLVMVVKFFLGKQEGKFVDPVLLNAVADLDVWNEYPWGSYIWSLTYKYMDGALGSLRRTEKMSKMTIYGFLHAFQIWILEMFPYSLKYFAMTDDVYPRALRWVKLKKILNNPQVMEFLAYTDGEYTPREGLVAEAWEQQQEWYGPSMEYLQHVISSRPPIHRRRRRAEVHLGGATPMDVEDIQDIRATLTRVDENYRGLMNRVQSLEHDNRISRVTGRHSVSDPRPTTLSGSTPPQFSQPDVARHSFHTGNTMGGGMNSSSYYAQPAFGQSSTFGMTGPTGFAPPAHGMAGSSGFARRHK